MRVTPREEWDRWRLGREILCDEVTGERYYIDQFGHQNFEPAAPYMGRGTRPAEEVPVLEERPFEIMWAEELVERVDSAPKTQWLIKPLWPADAYGVLAAEQKAGKTWANLDLCVSVASGTPWLGIYPVERSGTVLVFLGEGGERKMKRRLDAICTARGLELSELPIRFCFRVPHLTSAVHLAQLEEELFIGNPVLVILDPLYLAARGAKGSQLYEMGEHLERVQQRCQKARAALLIVHHWNKTGEGKGAKRMTGVGPGEWGRVLISVSVRSKRTDPELMATTAILDWEFEGDEIPDTELRLRRRVWATDPDDLSSTMHYELERVADDEAPDLELADLTPSARRVAMVLEAATDWLTLREVGDHLKQQGKALKPRTIQTALKYLVEEGLALAHGEFGSPYSWRSPRAPERWDVEQPKQEEF